MCVGDEIEKGHEIVNTTFQKYHLLRNLILRRGDATYSRDAPMVLD